VTPDIREYRDIQQMTAALLDGTIDGEVYSALYTIKENPAELRTVMKFLPETFYYAFRKDDISLKNRVDDALSQILAGNADYLANLKNKYEDQYDINNLPFSAAEKRYIEAHPVLTVAVLDNDEPYYSSAPGSPGRGILCDYYALAAEGTGLKFQYKVYATQDAAVAAVKNGDADILGIFSGGIIQSQEYGIALTDSFYTVDSILLTKAGTELDHIRAVAVAQRKKALLSDNIRKELPGAEIRTYETANLCFDALSRGAVDAVAAGHPGATWLMNQRNANAYNIIPIPYAANELCAAVNRKNLLLCSILNKRFGSTRGSFTGIVMKDTLPADDWLTVISRIPPALVVMIISILTVLVIGLAWTLVILRQRQKERVETEKRAIRMEAIQKNAEQQSRFFANMSHDMRTPLNAVLGFVRLAKKDSITSGQREEYLEKAELSGVLMLDLINDTLTMSKASSGKLELHPAVIDTDSLCRTIITPIQTLAAEKHITLSLDKSKYRSRSVSCRSPCFTEDIS
jgi:ABC-type amino acid transport substrate-binding protein